MSPLEEEIGQSTNPVIPTFIAQFLTQTLPYISELKSSIGILLGSFWIWYLMKDNRRLVTCYYCNVYEKIILVFSAMMHQIIYTVNQFDHIWKTRHNVCKKCCSKLFYFFYFIENVVDEKKFQSFHAIAFSIFFIHSAFHYSQTAKCWHLVRKRIIFHQF